MEKIVVAAVEKNYLTDGKDIKIDVTEIKNTTSAAFTAMQAAEIVYRNSTKL